MIWWQPRSAFVASLSAIQRTNVPIVLECAELFPMLYDVFFSYPWADSKNALRLAGALQTRGLTVWLDRKEIDTFESITRSIEFGLRHAKTLMAFYSENYVKSRICQWELTSAYLAAEIECEGGAKNRVLVINPCSSHHHIPSVLRDNIYKSLDGESDNDHLKAADDVAGHISSIQKTFGELQKLGPPEWYPERTTEWPRFVGRLNEMWGIHSLLKARDTVGSHGKPGNVALISGFGGVGKTLLAEEYALRFGSAYPGGVFWLKATGSPDSDEQEAIRSVQLRRLAEQQGIDVRNLTTDRILAALSEKIHSKGAPCLWVVDDLPGGLSRIELNAWLGPNSLCGTLFTTKSQRHAVGKKEIPLESLSRFDAMTLLCAHVEIAKTQEPAAVALLDDLGRHALACEVVGAWMKFSGKSPEEVRADLAQPHEDALDFAAEFSDDMPHAQVANVTNLLFESVERLNEQGRNFLRLASVLGEHPIPIKFVRSVFACIDGLIDKDGDRGIVNASDLSLARKASAKSWSVHSLISRAVRFRDSEKGKTAAFRDAALGVLGEELRVVEDGRKHDEIGDEFEHARHLAKAASTDEEILVLSWIGRQASEAGSLKSAKTIHEKLVAATRTLHGAEHDVTLTARHNQADFFRLMGDFEGAKRTHEEILSIRRCRRVRILCDDTYILTKHRLRSFSG